MNTRTKNFSLINRHSLKIVGDILLPENPRGMAVIHHGYSGQRQQPHIQTMAECTVRAGYTTVIFDGTHSFGMSDGDLFYSCATTHIEDLEDVIFWAETQDFYTAPFILMGHSLGGLSVLAYTKRHPEKVLALAPLATVISGDTFHAAKKEADLAGYETWRKTGSVRKASSTDPSRTGDMNWQLMEDIMQYDMLAVAEDFHQPVLLAAGRFDTSTPASQQQVFYERLAGKKEIHILEEAGHTFKGADLPILRGIIDTWLSGLSV